MNTSDYIPHLPVAARVRFIGLDRRRSGQKGAVIRILPNPSQRSEHQWYDVRFEDGFIVRVLEKELAPANEMDAA
jgi:hypothetical protein